MSNKDVNILGAGLVGSLLGTLLSRRDFRVDVHEMRSDPRHQLLGGGRSINLALSHRGIRALEEAGVFNSIKPSLIPMHGRMIHGTDGSLNYQPYGRKGEYIHSVSRSRLNESLIQAAEDSGVRFHFEHKCKKIDFKKGTLVFNGGAKVQGTTIIGADGAYSALRKARMRQDRFDYEQRYIQHGYKELLMPAAPNGGYQMEPNYLHIWPRRSYMFIALPNPGGTFTCTLFLPFEGENGFEQLSSPERVARFFESHFADALDKIPDLVDQFFQNPTSSLVTIKCSPWNYDSSLLIGDAAHAIVPFYGQGMNAGFEDCRLLIEMGDRMGYHWPELFQSFAESRKADADAIADLALANFVEMRDSVANERFLKMKRLEARLHDAYPDEWVPQYSMVTFTDTPYSEAIRLASLQKKALEGLPNEFDPEEIDLKALIVRLNDLKQAGL